MLTAIRKMFALFSPHERRQLHWLFAGMILAAMIEVAGIASIMPFLSLVANPEVIHENPLLKSLYELLNFGSVNRFLLFVGIVVLFVFTASNALSALVTWLQLRFTWMRNHTLSKRLLARYLHQPYAFFLNQNTAALGKNVLAEVFNLINMMLLPAMHMLAKSVVILFILMLLLSIDPRLTLVVATVLGGAYAAVYRLVRGKLSAIGEERVEANTERFKTSSEALGAIKYVKLLGKEEAFLDRYTAPSHRFSSHMATSQAIAQLPRYALETIAFGGILVIVLYLLASGQDLAYVLPLVGVYAFAGYRLMPALQIVFNGVAQVRFHRPLLDSIYQDLHTGERKGTDHERPRSPAQAEPLPFRDKLELREITFSYPGSRMSAIRNLSLTVPAHTSVALVGETGAGKTTVADIILGLLRPEGGRLLVDGRELTDETLPRWQKNLGYIPQEIYLHDDTVARNIAFGEPDEVIDREAVVCAAKVANIHEFVMTELPQGYETLIGERGIRLSGGQRQRIGIARALYHNPDVLVMDEATSALDGATESAVLDAIENVAQVKTLIMIAHRLSSVKDCDKVYLLEGGKVIAEGGYGELMESNARFRELAQVGEW